jgi:hypothetical protein
MRTHMKTDHPRFSIEQFFDCAGHDQFTHIFVAKPDIDLLQTEVDPSFGLQYFKIRTLAA